MSAASAASDSAASMTPLSEVVVGAVGSVLDFLDIDDMQVDWNAYDEEAVRARLVAAMQLHALIVIILLSIVRFWLSYVVLLLIGQLFLNIYA